LGGVSAATLMGLLLLFIEKSPKRSKDGQYLKEIVNALHPLAEFKIAEKMAMSRDVEDLEALTSQPAEGRISLNPTPADGRWGKEYTPAFELLH
jgi:hypothetical protein